jgi:hypothetical protein
MRSKARESVVESSGDFACHRPRSLPKEEKEEVSIRATPETVPSDSETPSAATAAATAPVISIQFPPILVTNATFKAFCEEVRRRRRSFI